MADMALVESVTRFVQAWRSLKDQFPGVTRGVLALADANFEAALSVLVPTDVMERCSLPSFLCHGAPRDAIESSGFSADDRARDGDSVASLSPVSDLGSACVGDELASVWLWLDHESFRRASGLEEWSVVLWSRWFSQVEDSRKWGPFREKIAVCIEELPLGPFEVRAALCDRCDLSDRVWLVFGYDLFSRCTGYQKPWNLRLWARWYSGVSSSRLWGDRRQKIAFCLEELSLL